MEKEKSLNTLAAYQDGKMTYSHIRFIADGKTHYGRHAHRQHEMHLMLSGGDSYIVENVVYPLSAYDLMVIKSGDYHHYMLKNDGSLHEKVYLYFDDDAFSSEVYGDFFRASRSVSLSEAFFADWVRRMDTALSVYPDRDKPILVRTLFTELFLHLKNLSENETLPRATPINNRILELALRYVNENIESVKTAGELAEAVFVSESYLYAIFKQNLAISPKKYIMKKKLLRAEAYIKAGAKPTAVAEQLGFSDYSTFFRAYRQYIGTSPMRQCRGGTQKNSETV